VIFGRGDGDLDNVKAAQIEETSLGAPLCYEKIGLEGPVYYLLDYIMIVLIN
jgi:hypothetical protein